MALAISIGLNYCFVYILHKNAAWLALTTSVVTTFNFLFYFFYLRRQLGGVDGRTLLSGLVKIMAAGILLGAVCWAGKAWFLQGFLNWTFPARVLGISLVCGCAGIVYLGGGFPAEDAGAGSGARQIPEMLTGKIPSIEGGTPSARKRMAAASILLARGALNE